jgi:hypothetical protein
VGLIQQIINFIKRLLGMGGDEPALGSGAASSGASAQAGSSSFASSATDSDDTDSDSDHPGAYARENWQELQQFIRQFEASGENMAGVDWQQPVTWWKKQFGVEEAQQNGKSAEQAIREHGFRDRDHMDRVGQYVAAKWSRFGENDDGEDDVLIDDEYQNAALQARTGQVAAMQANALAADPSLLQPVAGVSLDQWANAAATMAQMGSATPQQVSEALARIGITKEQYDQANAGWQAKMQGDTTFVIATKYGEAFQKVQQGVAQQQGLGGANGGEPCTFEKFVEVMVAQGCWSEQGIDVASQLQKTFGINIPEYSRWSAYWSPKMGMDVKYARQYDQLEKQYKAKYKGAGLDDDLSL